MLVVTQMDDAKGLPSAQADLSLTSCNSLKSHQPCSQWVWELQDSLSLDTAEHQ